MEPEHSITFGPFRLALETPQARLWRGEQAITLRPRSLAVLRYLVEHPGRLVTKAELRQHVWAGLHVTDTALRVCIRDIRAALDDTAVAPQYLKTVGSQGYQWRGLVQRSVPPSVAAGPLVGRQREVDALEAWFQRAATGDRQLVFVSGDVGIGKTTVLDLWLARRAADSEVRIARGQCVEHTGEGEPYLPVLAALGRLGHQPGGSDLLAVLRRYAPLWLVHLLGLVSEADLERLQRQVQGATQARMLRELVEALEVLTAERPLVLVLEDLHWSDTATVECLTAVAQGREPARLLILGTYRPVEAVLRAHPLRGMVQELCGRGYGVELHLECLPAADVAAYVAGRLGGPLAAPLAAFIYARTDGNALFMVNLVEHLVQQGRVVWREGQWTLGEDAAVMSLPEGLRQLLLRRIEALAPEVRRVLEAASVVGEAFAVAAVAAGAQCPVEAVEAVCEELAAQQHFLDETGLTDWPDGTSGGSYRFRHALYQQVLYEQLGRMRRTQLHRRIGTQLEAGYGVQTGEVSAQLVVHFERSGDMQRAVHYAQQAGEHAARRHAPHTAIAMFTKGLALLATLQESPARTQHELRLQLALGDLLMAVQWLASPAVSGAYTRAHALCQQMEETPQLCRVLWGLFQSQCAQGQLRTAGELSQQLLHLAQRQPETDFLLEGQCAVGTVALYRGDFSAARAHLAHSLQLFDALQSPALNSGLVAGVLPLTLMAQALGALGYADQAQKRNQEAIALVRQAEHSPSLAFMELVLARFSQCRRDVAATQAHADALMTLAAVEGFALRLEQGRILRGWALAMSGDTDAGMAHMRQGFAALQGVGPGTLHPYLLSLLAEAYSRAGQPEAGLRVLAESLTLMATTDVRWWEAEVYRLQGEILLASARSPAATRQTWAEAEACFHQALTVARGQQARALELRAALSLSRLWLQQRKRKEARQLLAPLYAWFTEGFDTADLQEAQALLEQRDMAPLS